MMAAASNDVACVQALLRAGADIGKKNKEGNTALSLAREYKNSEIVALLTSRGAPD